MSKSDQELYVTLELFREILEGSGYEPDGAKVWWNNRAAATAIKSGFSHGELWVAIYTTSGVRTQVGTTHHFTGSFNELDMARLVNEVVASRGEG